MNKILLLVLIALAMPAAYAGEPLRYGEKAQPSGIFFGLGFGKDLRGNAAFDYRGHLYSGYKFENGIKVEFRHVSVLGSDDGIDVNGDNENDYATSENELFINWEHWIQ